MTRDEVGALLHHHIAIVGKTGAGKTYAAKGAVEWLLEQRRRVCILDPTGVWHGLRSAADGVSPGFPVVVFGGEHGDVPITEHAGAQLAEIIAGRNFPCIVDISEFTQGQKHRFLTAFAGTLYIKNRSPLHFIIDEADEVAPQNPLPDSRQMLHEFDRIVRRGRARGFRIMLISQRPAVLHKNVLTQANTLVAMRLPAPQDRKAIEEWVKGQADVELWAKIAKSLPGLPRGEGWVWAPEQDILEKVVFPPIKTFDSSRAPDDGEEIAEPRTLAPVEVEELRALLAPETEERSDAARDVEYIVDDEENRRLREAVAGLEEQLAAARHEADEARREAQDARDRLAAIASIIGQGRAPAPPETPLWREEVAAVPVESRDSQAPAVERAAPPRPQAPAPPVSAGRAKTTRAGHAEKLSKAERSILTALAQYHQGRTKTQVAILTGYAVSGGGYNNALSSLRTKGWLEGGGDHLRITPAGLSALGPFQPLPRGRALLDHWLSQLDKAPRTILDTVARSYPRPMSKEEVARATNYEAAGGGFNNALSRLRTLELITRGQEIRASDALFGR